MARSPSPQHGFQPRIVWNRNNMALRSIERLTPSDNRAQGRWWTQLIFPVSGCGINA